MADQKAKHNPYFVIDFDSTFIQFEALDELAAIALDKDPEQKQKRLGKIKEYTKLGMEGKMSFPETLLKRIELLNAGKQDIDQVVEKLKKNISTSIERNKEFFEKYADRIFIISGGFKEYIAPVVAKYDIPSDQIFANTFEFNKNGQIIGFDQHNYLAQEGGKVKQLKNMGLDGDVLVIGDGYTDFQLKEAGLAKGFYAFTENIERANLLDKADHVAPSFDEFLYKHQLPMAISYPKNRIKVLLLGDPHPKAEEKFIDEGYHVQSLSQWLTEEELYEKVKDVSILCVGNNTQVTQKVVNNARRLLAIGVFGIEATNVDTDACLENGVVVLNAPYRNTRSVVELAIGNMIALLRQTHERNREMQEGVWNKSFTCGNELRGKKLGIIGYGNIGHQMAQIADAMKMEVIHYDLINKPGIDNKAPYETMEQLLADADIVSIHVDNREENENLINEGGIQKMKDRALLVNSSNGKVIDAQAVAKNLKNGKLSGAALDVFSNEPLADTRDFSSEFQGISNAILTPHIGEDTEEAQLHTASFVPNKLIHFINSGEITRSVNFPDIKLPSFEDAHRLIHIHQNEPGLLARINQIFAEHNINIVGQYLKTNDKVGYVITDISKGYDENVIEALRAIKNTIKIRLLY